MYDIIANWSLGRWPGQEWAPIKIKSDLDRNIDHFSWFMICDLNHFIIEEMILIYYSNHIKTSNLWFKSLRWDLKNEDHKSTQTSVFNHSSKDTKSGKRGCLYKEKQILDLLFKSVIRIMNHFLKIHEPGKRSMIFHSWFESLLKLRMICDF